MEKNILGNKEEAKSSTPLFSDSFGINATMHRLGPPTVGKTRPQKVVLKGFSENRHFNRLVWNKNARQISNQTGTGQHKRL